MYSKNVQDRGYNSYGNGGAVVSTSYRNMKNPLPGGTTTPIPTTAANLKKNISNASTTPNISINTSTNLGYVESFTNNNNNNNTNTNLNSDKNSNSTPSNTSNPTTSIPLTTTSAPKNKNS